MYSDFKNLQVTVSQTQNITAAGHHRQLDRAPYLRSAPPNVDFMQMMECYGDSASGPSPEGCEYGSRGMLGGEPTTSPAAWASSAGSRARDQPSTRPRPRRAPTATPSDGCDTDEPAAETPPTATRAPTADHVVRERAFLHPLRAGRQPADPLYTRTPTAPARREFDQFNTNEVQDAHTARGRHRPAAVRDADREPGTRTRLRRDREQRPDPRLLAGHRAARTVSSRTASTFADRIQSYADGSTSTRRR